VLFVVSVIAIYAVTWLWPEVATNRHPVLHVAGLPSGVLASLSMDDRLLVALVSVPYLAVLVWAFYRLVRMLRMFERGLFFDRQTVSDLRAFSGLLLVSKALALAAMHARVALVVHLLGRDKVRVMVNLSSDDLAILLLCALFFAIAAMMEEGRKLAEENREFV
jgi:hypothetical protein